ncbi:hypothetical protein J8281_03710 [Aquimarina sp. U1-2]|uniref:hypothetical protein n=1 Tax=Aquimarina sp. U1-2 TaxID=2823141 RepID=UPI001AECA76E|nr:hypothetical protein [Aquimarina sp. U1-2]MBP2831284.1 hypothetical protein [Aquimarina sp. U1-2]
MSWIKVIGTVRKLLPFLLILLLGLQIHFWRKEKQKVKDFQEVYRIQQKEIEIWRDEAGKNRTRADIAEIKAANANIVLKEDLKMFLKKEVGNLKRNLISYSIVKASTTGDFKTGTADTLYVLNEIKSLPAKKFFINNPDLKFEGLYIPQLDTLTANYQVIHNFDIFYYYKKPGKFPLNIFRRRKAVAEIRFENKGSQADSLFTLVLERRRGLLRSVMGK